MTYYVYVQAVRYQVPTFKPSSAMFNPLGTFFPRPIHRQ